MIRQKTIKGAVVIEGKGLQTGSKVRLAIKSAPADSGINFIRVDLPNKPLISVQSLFLEGSAAKPRRTTLGSGPAQVQTTEHLLAAISGLGINNIIIESDGIEIPGLDGSAKEYVEALDRAGVIEQDAPVRSHIILKEFWCARKGSLLAALPHDGFKISYFLSYASIGDQFLSVEISPDTFRREIAPARTFCVKKEAIFLRALGLGRGANCENTLIMGKSGPLGNALRFPDEPVRHKILDLIGDLCLIGASLKGHIIAVKSGHVLNMELVRRLKDSNKF